MPSIYYLSINKTTFQQFGAIFKDEGTIKGTYSVYKSIFLDQLSLYTPEDPTKARAIRNNFYNRLQLIHRDQLIAIRIRAVKNKQTQAR